MPAAVRSPISHRKLDRDPSWLFDMRIILAQVDGYSVP